MWKQDEEEMEAVKRDYEKDKLEHLQALSNLRKGEYAKLGHFQPVFGMISIKIYDKAIYLFSKGP